MFFFPTGTKAVILKEKHAHRSALRFIKEVPMNPLNQEELLKRIAAKIVDVPDFPETGILFKDITPLLADHDALHATIQWMADALEDIDYVISPEARGFIFGTAAACMSRKAGFIPLRKPGKLPRNVFSETYGLEYGTDELQMHIDDLPKGAKVAFIDDVLATGGTLKACEKLVASAGATLEKALFLIELDFLKGREGTGCAIQTLIHC